MARSGPSTLLFGALFACDRLFEGRLERGSAFLALARKPSAREAMKCAEVVREFGLPVMCRAMFNANEFLYVN